MDFSSGDTSHPGMDLEGELYWERVQLQGEKEGMGGRERRGEERRGERWRRGESG